ncbi:cytochrome c biogenesis transmembrane protein [Aminivibrio pyruvatiphilus]|uniref:Cytochrome c biogenesis transmembrane protein n=1 Tax=Aminivibrio pyruvatiphilus TaxID=1005740 RepID=A0A4R8MGT5_9BACT|nr:cytochrome c biogenesis protein CcdA [Aminivibrio pyruvatiphilus]TDY65150.1 cytochrome c biogenesis transmembrane protein [Aminivibrio pyruvatiphilus]
MIDGWLAALSESIRAGTTLAPLLALLAGLATSVTPCALTSVPLVIAYVGGTAAGDPRKGFVLSAVFSAGMALTFTVLGAAASMLGRLMGTSSSWWYILLGVLMLLMGLQILEIFNFLPSTNLLSKNTKRGYAGAFLAGVLGGFFSSPCATPVLVVLLSIVAGSGEIGRGILLLLLYSLGHSILVLAAGTSVGFAAKLVANKKYGVFSIVLKYCLGAGALLISFAMFYLGF